MMHRQSHRLLLLMGIHRKPHYFDCMFTSSSSSSSSPPPQRSERNNNDDWRRLLSPIVKAIHPDLFIRDTVKVQQTNLKCLQTVNEMCDSIETIFQQIGSRKTDLDILTPLPQQFNLVCYLRQNSSNNPTPKQDVCGVRQVEIFIRTPAVLCSRHRVSRQLVNQAIYDLLFQLGSLGTHAGLLNPFEHGRSGVGGGNDDGNDEDTIDIDIPASPALLKSLQKAADLRGFEANLIADHRAALLSRVYRMHADRDPWRRRRRRHKFDSDYEDDEDGDEAVGGPSKEQRRRQGLQRQRDGKSVYLTSSPSSLIVAVEVDAFLSMGQHVLVRGLTSPREEYEAIQALRSFLVDFGSLINFTFGSLSSSSSSSMPLLGQWRDVIIIITGDHKVEDKDAEKNTREYVLHGKRETKSQQQRAEQKCTCTLVNGKYLFQIPMSCVMKGQSALLDFFRTHLPVANTPNNIFGR